MTQTPRNSLKSGKNPDLWDHLGELFKAQFWDMMSEKTIKEESCTMWVGPLVITLFIYKLSKYSYKYHKDP